MTDQEHKVALAKAREEGRAEGFKEAESREAKFQLGYGLARFAIGFAIGGVCAAKCGLSAWGVVISGLIGGIVLAGGLLFFLLFLFGR